MTTIFNNLQFAVRQAIVQPLGSGRWNDPVVRTVQQQQAHNLRVASNARHEECGGAAKL